jgi:ribosomal protein S25
MRQDRAQQKDQSQVITEIDQSWINAAKKDIKALDQITDPSYKARIQNLIN